MPPRTPGYPEDQRHGTRASRDEHPRFSDDERMLGDEDYDWGVRRPWGPPPDEQQSLPGDTGVRRSSREAALPPAFPGRARPRRGPKGYVRSDERIREEVCDKLGMHDELDASDVEVTVKDGEVFLSGTVETRQMKFIAEQICDSVSGVKDIVNQLRLTRPSTSPNERPRGMA